MSKRIKAAFLILCAIFASGCSSDQSEVKNADSASLTQEATLPDIFPMDLTFSSGAGAWGTFVTLNRDGTFDGTYNDTDMGDSGDNYPNGTMYVCNFEGRFTNIQPLDKHSYSLTLTELSSDHEDGKEWVEDGIRYVSTIPYGMEDGTDFILYLPETPVDGLSEDFLSWWPNRFTLDAEHPDTLKLVGLYNTKMGYGLFG